MVVTTRATMAIEGRDNSSSFQGAERTQGPNTYPGLYEWSTILQNNVPPKFTSAFYEAFSSCIAYNIPGTTKREDSNMEYTSSPRQK